LSLHHCKPAEVW